MTTEFKIDASGFAPAFERLSKFGPWIRNKVLGEQFPKQAKVYLVREMDAAMKEGSTLQEGQSKQIRGQTWRGWKLSSVKKYGTVVFQSTRYYFRKFARSATNLKKAQGATFSKSTRNSKWGKGDHVIEHGNEPRNFGQEFHVRSRPFEKVWTKRASGKRYSASSKLLLDTGAMRQALIAMETKANTGANISIEFRPGKQAKYFNDQNAIRPIFVWQLPKDAEKLGELLQAATDKEVERLNLGGLM
jgi:hypothetical protein